MKQIFIKYNEWEDYLEGMYETKKTNKEDNLIYLNIKLLTDEKEFLNQGLRVLNNWKKSCDVNLTNKNINRLAWIGQASCFISHGSTEIITKKSWKLINSKQKILANYTASKILKEYEKRYNEIYREMGKKMLF